MESWMSLLNFLNVSGTTVQVDVASQNSTANSGSDYVSVSETLIFAAGEISKTVSISITDDSIYDPNEAFLLTLSNPSNAVLGAQSGAQVNIDEDDNAPVISVADVTMPEGDSTGTLTFTISTDQVAGFDITVGYQIVAGTATAAEDFTAPTLPVTILAGESSTSVVVTINGDTDVESDETFTINLTSVSSGAIDSQAGSATATLTNDDSSSSSTIYLPLITRP